MSHSTKLVIVGLGHVGSYVLADAVQSGLFADIAVIDKDESVAFGEALDQHHATGVPGHTVPRVRRGDYSDCADADVIISAAGPSMIVDPDDPDGNPDRAALAPINGDITRDVMAQICRNVDLSTPEKRDNAPILIFITNPADTIVWIAQNEFGYPERRIFGTGTMLDSSRLRRIIADELEISPESVSGYMMGEHGMAAFPVLSHVHVMGVPVAQLGTHFPGAALDPDDLARRVVDAAYDVFHGKGWTNAGVAASAVRLARAVLLDERVIYPVSTTLHGEYGHDGDVALSLPCLIGREGVLRRFEVALNDWEIGAMNRSVDAVRAAIESATPPAQ